MAPPPGSSYVASNTFSRASRRALGLQDPIRIQFRKGWGPGNPLFHWYEGCPNQIIQTIQLRKDREYPFFHEYIAITLQDGARYRIDRRQLPNEEVPLDSVYSNGVEAYDTIEEIAPYNYKLYCASECLVEVNFKELPLSFVIRICWAIHRNKATRLYTLQRYNCYFFAQTIITCAVRSSCKWYISTCRGRNDKPSNTRTRKGSFHSRSPYGSVSSFGATGFEGYLDSFSSDTDSTQSYHQSSSSLSSPTYDSTILSTDTNSSLPHIIIDTITENLHDVSVDNRGYFPHPNRGPSSNRLSRPSSVCYVSHPPQISDIRPFNTFAYDDWQSHTDSEGRQSSTLADLLRLIPNPLYQQLAVDKAIWPLLQRLGSSAPDSQLKYDWSNLFEQFSQQNQSPHQLYARHVDKCGIHPRLMSVHKRLSKGLIKFEGSLKNYWGQIVSDILGDIASDAHDLKFGVSVGLWHDDINISGQLVRLVDRLVLSRENYNRESWANFVSARLQELFIVLEDLHIVQHEWLAPNFMWGSHPYSYTSASDVEMYNKDQRDLACQRWLTEVLEIFDLEFDKLGKALRRQIADTWGKSLRSSLEERTGSFRKRMRIAVTKIPFARLSRRRHFTYVIAPGSNALQASTHIEMQNLVIQLIRSHSVRVGQYKRWLNLRCTASEVEADIKSAMGEIWDQITTRANCEACGGTHPFNFDPESVY